MEVDINIDEQTNNMKVHINVELADENQQLR